MRRTTREDIRQLWLEYTSTREADPVRFYLWADDIVGPITPEDRNTNPCDWIKQVISETAN